MKSRHIFQIVLNFLLVAGCTSDLDRYISEHNLQPETQLAMRMYQPLVGMSHESLCLMGTVRVQTDSPCCEVAIFYPKNTPAHEENAYSGYVLTMEDGKVVAVQYPLRMDSSTQ
jgi:hypothetical protein